MTKQLWQQASCDARPKSFGGICGQERRYSHRKNATYTIIRTLWWHLWSRKKKNATYAIIRTLWWGRLHADQDVVCCQAPHHHRSARPPPKFSPILSSDSPSAAQLLSFSLRNNNSTLLCRQTESEERVSVVLPLLLHPALNSSQPELLLTPAKLRSVNWVTLILAVFFAHLDHLRRSPRGGEVGEVGREKRGRDVLVFLTLSDIGNHHEGTFTFITFTFTFIREPNFHLF